MSLHEKQKQGNWMEKQYLLTERAHLMCPNMEFGICAFMKSEYKEAKVKETIQNLSQAHPFLQSRIAKEENSKRLYYSYHADVFPEVMVKQDSKAMTDDYIRIKKNIWNAFEESLLKIVVYPEQTGFKILFVAHHLLCDGKGLLQLAEEFADSYAEGKVPEKVCERLIQSDKDLPEKSELPFISKMVISSANRNWIKESHKVSYEEYLRFEKKYRENKTYKIQVESIPAEETDRMIRICRENQVSVNDYLLAKMMLENHVSKVIVAADVRESLKCYQKGSLGNFSTAFSVVSKTKTKDEIAKAKDISTKIKAIRSSNSRLMTVLSCYLLMEPELLDAVAISGLGDFQSKAGSFVADKMFGFCAGEGYSITNLGRRENRHIEELVFLPPGSPAIRKIQGIVSINGKMSICTIS